MKKIISMLIVSILVSLIFEDTSYGATKASVTFDVNNTSYSIKANSKVTVSLKNGNNKEEVGVDIQPQKYSKNKWVDLGVYDYDYIDPNKTIKSKWTMKDFNNTKGTYRFKITVYKFDEDGDEIYQGYGFTRNFTIKK